MSGCLGCQQCEAGPVVTLFTRGQFLAIQPRTYLRFEPVEE
jgi:hypothetical protein